MTQNPKYKKIAEDIIKKIDQGIYRSNNILPSENKMCEQYDTSRITVRKAIEELVKKGYIFKKGGKGSFVCDNMKAEGLTKVHSFTESIIYQGKTPSKKLIKKHLIWPNKELCQAFSINDLEQVYEIITIYYSNNIPFCFNKAYLPHKYFPKLEVFDLEENSLYEILGSFYKLSPLRAKQKITAVLGEGNICEYLNCDQKIPLLRLDAQSYAIYNNEEVLVEIYEAYILSDIMPYYSVH